MNYNIYNTYDCSTQCPASYNMFPNPNCIFPSNSLIQSSLNETKNRFVYINQNFINAYSAVKPKVLINPNFKPTVHINPNFKNPLKPSIHVNPNIIKLSETTSAINSTDGGSSNKLNHVSEIKAPPLISTKTKLVRVINKQIPSDAANHERRQSLHTKYKIVHGNDNAQDSSFCENYLKNRYKIDKNVLRSKKLLRKVNVKSKYSIQNTSLNKKKNKKPLNSKYISINGTLYKKTPNVLRRADLMKMTSGKTNISKNKVLLIRGQLYKLDHHQRRLKMLSSSPYPLSKLKGTPKLKKCSKSFKLNRSKQRISLSDVDNSPNRILINKMRKCNMPCPIYRKFGKCKAKEMGKCIRVHNPDQISLCTKFLQGACFNSKCLLSHKVSPEKMPTCKYFLEGLCTREDCVYLHVKISAKAEICKDFLEGYCKKAKECLKRHQFLCPDYEKNGSCSRKRCQYPHGNLVRKTEYPNKVAKRIIKKKSTSKLIETDSNKVTIENEHDKNVRYYVENSEEAIDKIQSNAHEDGIDNENLVDDSQSNGPNFKLLKRSQLGILPSYIPFGKIDSLLHDVII